MCEHFLLFVCWSGVEGGSHRIRFISIVLSSGSGGLVRQDDCVVCFVYKTIPIIIACIAITFSYITQSSRLSETT